MTLNILGTEYELLRGSSAQFPKLQQLSGYCEPWSKKLVVLSNLEPHALNIEKEELFFNEVIRHEIVHAFLLEGGLDSDWAKNEEIVDWIALQIPKMQKVINQVGAM